MDLHGNSFWFCKIWSAEKTKNGEKKKRVCWLIPGPLFQNVGFWYLDNLYQCKLLRTLGSNTVSDSSASVLGIYILDLST